MKQCYSLLEGLGSSEHVGYKVVLMIHVYIYIYIYNIFLSWDIIEKKKHLATWGLEPAAPVSVNRHTYYALDHHTSPKKDVSSPELSNTALFHSSIFGV